MIIKETKIILKIFSHEVANSSLARIAVFYSTPTPTSPTGTYAILHSKAQRQSPQSKTRLNSMESNELMTWTLPICSAKETSTRTWTSTYL